MKFLSRLLVDFAYFLNTSTRYQKSRRLVYNLLENDEYKYKKYFDIFMMSLIFSSVSILIYSVKQDIPHDVDLFNTYIVSFVFLIEYILRLWVISSISKVIIHQDEYSDLLGKEFDFGFIFKRILKDKLKHIISFKAIIDLLAILPFFHELRLLRIFILFRVFKFFRYTKSFQLFTSILKDKKFEFLTLGMFASVVIFISSVIVYAMEANNPDSKIDTLYQAFYWSIVTISTVGYGDVVAISDEGQFVAVVVIITGISVLAFTTSLFVSAFAEKLEDIKEEKTLQDVSKIDRIYILCGYENIAKEVGKKLLQDDYNVIVLDESQQRVENAKKDGLQALNYNPGQIESYKKLHIDLKTQVKAILCLREDDVENVYTALTVRSIDKDVYIMSLLINSNNRHKLLSSGINEVLYDKEFVGVVARVYVGQPVAFEAIHAYSSNNTAINVEEIVVTERVIANITKVEELDNVRFRVVLLGLYKKNSARFLFNPIDSTILELGDVLLVVGNYMFIKEFETTLLTRKR